MLLTEALLKVREERTPNEQYVALNLKTDSRLIIKDDNTILRVIGSTYGVAVLTMDELVSNDWMVCSFLPEKNKHTEDIIGKTAPFSKYNCLNRQKINCDKEPLSTDKGECEHRCENFSDSYKKFSKKEPRIFTIPVSKERHNEAVKSLLDDLCYVLFSRYKG